MDFPFFTEDERPTMENFNKKFRALLMADKKIVTGTYVGNSSNIDDEIIQTINLGFTPLVVIVSSAYGEFSGFSGGSWYCWGGMCLKDVPLRKTLGTDHEKLWNLLNIVENGFQVHEIRKGRTGGGGNYDYVHLNSSNHPYMYIAFG